MCFGVMNNKTDRVPIPSKTIERAKEFNQIEQIVKIAGKCINTALKSASNKQQPENRVFSPQNWIKNKTCLDGITAAIDQYFDMLPTIEGAGSNYEILKKALSLNQEDFEYRWAAD